MQGALHQDQLTNSLSSLATEIAFQQQTGNFLGCNNLFGWLSMDQRIRCVSMVIAMAIGLSSCSKTDNKTPPLSQVAAKVNGDEISVHEVNNLVASGNNTAALGQNRPAAPQVLEQLIERELLAQNALAAKLDRDPQVMQAMEAAKHQILAQAYLERTIAAASRHDTDASVRVFYTSNPALFEQRRIYECRELLASLPAEKLDLLKAESAKTRSLDDLEGWFKLQNVPFNSVTSTRAAEQIPLDVLQRVAEMKDGEVAVFATPNRVSVLQLVHAQDAPLNEQQARPVIEQFLANRTRLELARAEVKRLREKARIEYVGEFEAARLKASVASTPQPPGEASAAVGTEDEHLKKGLSGLL